MTNMTIDIATNALMQSIESPVLTVFSKIIAHALDPLVLAIISILIATFVYIKVSKKQGIFFAATILSTGIIIKVLKEIFQKTRPLNSLIPETGFSLPSGHATIVVVFFGLLVYLFVNKRYKLTASIITILIIFLTDFTRIYLRVHWLTDVITGFILGGLILITSIIIYKKF